MCLEEDIWNAVTRIMTQIMSELQRKWRNDLGTCNSESPTVPTHYTVFAHLPAKIGRFAVDSVV